MTKMNWIAWAGLWSATLLLTPSCRSFGYVKESSVRSNRAALVSPRWVTLKPGEVYNFSEGMMIGEGQVYMSSYQFRRLLIEETK
jgi:hypothetical protein